MTALRRAAAVGVAAPGLGAWARGAGGLLLQKKNKRFLRVRPESNWRPQDLQSYALPLSYTPAAGAGGRPGKKATRARGRASFGFVMTGVGFEPTPPKRRELESPALDHSAIQPWPRPRRTAGQRRRKSLRSVALSAPSRGTRPNSHIEIKKRDEGP